RRQRAEEGHEELGPRGHDDRDALARLHAGGGEGRGEATRTPAQLGVGQALLVLGAIDEAVALVARGRGGERVEQRGEARGWCRWTLHVASVMAVSVGGSASRVSVRRATRRQS